MNHDQNKKTLRQFQCRDYLWEIFEQMSGELECSVDYLINEAMRQYARSRNYGVRGGAPGAHPSAPAHGAPAHSAPAHGGHAAAVPSAPPPPPGGGYGGGYGGGAPGYPPPPPGPAPSYGANPGYPSPQQRAQVPQRSQVPQRPSSYPPPPPTNRPGGGYGAPAAQANPYPAQQGGFGGQPMHGTPPQQQQQHHQHQAPPPPLPGGGGGHAHPGQMIPMYVIFNGQKFPVAKEEFIIGRGTKTADLPIKDGNISRRHAAVIWQNGGWYMKDLGSTNGVEFHGRKIDSKRIDEGDVYQLCDYEVRFTYR
ncbi:MAG: FHA domain-containing protein [Sandaracinaceae bacterium]